MIGSNRLSRSCSNLVDCRYNIDYSTMVSKNENYCPKPIPVNCNCKYHARAGNVACYRENDLGVTKNPDLWSTKNVKDSDVARPTKNYRGPIIILFLLNSFCLILTVLHVYYPKIFAYIGGEDCCYSRQWIKQFRNLSRQIKTVNEIQKTLCRKYFEQECNSIL